MMRIPLLPEPAQALQIILSGQECSLAVFQRLGSMYCDLDAGGYEICRGALCLDRVFVLQSPTPRFSGNLIFADTQGKSHPEWSGLGSRYRLYYLDDTEKRSLAELYAPPSLLSSYGRSAALNQAAQSTACHEHAFCFSSSI